METKKKRKKKKMVEIECEKKGKKNFKRLAKGNLLHFPFANKMNIEIELSETYVQ